MVLQWHNNRRLLPHSMLEHHVYPNALEPILAWPDGSEVAWFPLARDS